MPVPKFDVSREDLDVIDGIASRFMTLQRQFRSRGDVREKMHVVMDLCAVQNSCPLKLDELLKADDSNFVHDLCGIERHLDRDTGELTDCFLPRYAA